jgi:hypothetical protein
MRNNALFFCFPPRAVPGIQIDENRENKEKLAEAENNELKTNTELHPVVFAYLGQTAHTTRQILL